MASPINPVVIDISHYNEIAKPNGLKQAAASGIWGVIHKVTESTGYVDDEYASSRVLAKEAGLLWGAYHFVRPGSMEAQVNHFLSHSAYDSETLLALDWEVSDVSVSQASEFLMLVAEKSGHKPILYSGHTAKDMLGSKVDPFLGSHNLWLAQYASTWTVQASWSSPWLWQYSGDGTGPSPHGVPGVTTGGASHCDMNSYQGNREQLTREWSGTSGVVLPPIQRIIPETPENVRKLQAELNTYPTTIPGLVVDGNLGDKTFTAIMRALEV